MKTSKARILALVAAAAAALMLIFSVGGAASAATTAPAAQQAAIAQQATSTITPADARVKYDYYSDELLCELEGEVMIGEPWDGGQVVDYECVYNGEPGPVGPWVLYLYVVNSCPGAQPAGTRVAPDRTCG